MKIYLKPNFANAIGIPINRIEKSWNSFDSIDKTTRVVHFTNLATQPWKRADHPYEFDWFVLAQDAFASGILTQEDIEIQKQFGQLRTDFDQKLRNPLSREDTFTRLVNQARLFYRNLKFHSPVKYMYSELVN